MDSNAQQHDGNLPDSFEQLTGDANGVLPFTNPRAAAGKPSYVYVKPAAKLIDARNKVIIYENLDALPPGTDRVSAGFPDGHVEIVTPQRLRELLAANKVTP